MNNKNNDKLPKWNQDQINAQKKINRRLTYRTAGALFIVLVVVVVAIVVAVASNNKDATPQAPATNANVSEVEKYEMHKFSDNNAASINSIKIAKSTHVLLVKLDNVDVSSESSASNSFSQLSDELQSVGNYDVASKGVIFYSEGPYTNDNGETVTETSFAIYLNQSNIQSLNSNYSDYLGSGNYTNLFKNADAYYLYQPFSSSNRKLNKLPAAKSDRIIKESINTSVK